MEINTTYKIILDGSVMKVPNGFYLIKPENENNDILNDNNIIEFYKGYILCNNENISFEEYKKHIYNRVKLIEKEAPFKFIYNPIVDKLKHIDGVVRNVIIDNDSFQKRK